MVNVNVDFLFGPFHTKEYVLQLGHTQNMQFSDTDPGPCYYSESERLAKRYDINTGKKRVRNMVRDNLIDGLKSIGIKDPKGNRKKLKDLTVLHNLPTTYEETVIDEGWVGKPKGALQILYERGWVDPQRLGDYTWKGKDKNENVLVSEDEYERNKFSLQYLIRIQDDFKNEMTLLQYHASKLGVTLDRSPKCHPEIAGEGIEYGWAFSKQEYRRSPITLKRSKTKFWDLVRSCLDNTGIMNIKRMRLCSKKSRQYMKLYTAVKAIEDCGIDEGGVMLRLNKYSILEESLKLYRRLQKKRFNHRSVTVTDIRSVEREFEECEYADQTPNNDLSKEQLIRYLVKKMITL